MKKFFNILGGIGILSLSTISCTFAYTQEQRDAYQWAYSYGITTQPTIEAANLDGNLTRQAFAKMVVNYLENVAGVKQTVSNSCSFPDENKITNDLKPYAKKTCAYQIMGSNGTNFNPTNIVNRAQLGTVLSRILWGNEYNTSGKGYYIYHLNALKFNGIMNKIDNPQTYAKRGDVLIMLKRIYEKYGSNIYMNGYQDSSYTTPITNININDNTTNNTITNQETTYNEDNTVSNIYSNSNVVYTGEDGTKYVYDDNFLNVLMDTAKEKGENDLYKFLEIEASYYKNGLDQIANIDMDELAESLGIDEDLDPDNLTAKEKSELLKKVKEGISKLIKENKDKNEEYLDKLEKITKNVSSSDKFGLKEKYKKTKGFVDASISFLDLYSETILNLLELTLTSEDGEIDDGEGMAIAFTLIGIALAYQGEAQDYQSYLEEWTTNTINLLGGELNTNTSNNKGNNTTNNTDNSNGTLVCTLDKSNFISGTNIKSTYKINYNGEYVNLVDTVEIVNSDDEEIIEYFKNTVEKTYEPYKNLKYYDYDIKTTKNTMTSKVTINYEKIDMDKFVEINPNEAAIFVKNNKISLEKLIEYYEMIGATCK